MIKIGDKVKIPKTKSVWGNLESSVCVRDAKKNGQDFMYVRSIKNDGRIAVADSKERGVGGDYFLESDLELYIEEVKEMIGFKVGDKVKKKDGTAFSNGAYILTIKEFNQYFANKEWRPTFKETGTHSSFESIELVVEEYKGFKEGSTLLLFSNFRKINKDSKGYYFVDANEKRTSGQSVPLKNLIDNFEKDIKVITKEDALLEKQLEQRLEMIQDLTQKNLELTNEVSMLNGVINSIDKEHLIVIEENKELRKQLERANRIIDNLI